MPSVRGWKIRAREADCRCWATLSAMSFRAEIFSEVEVVR